jgi:hypothetical protein
VREYLDPWRWGNMKDTPNSNETELRRRDVLKRGATATSALVVGGTAVSGAAAKKNKKNKKNTGGMRAVTLEFTWNPGNPFIVRSELEDPDGEQPASCIAPESKVKAVDTFLVDYEPENEGSTVTAYLNVRENRAQVLRDAIDTGDEFVFTSNAQECKYAPDFPFTIVKGTIKPV